MIGDLKKCKNPILTVDSVQIKPLNLILIRCSLHVYPILRSQLKKIQNKAGLEKTC